VSILKLRQSPPAFTPELGVVLQRIASATSVIRTRSEDVRRESMNGGSVADVLARYASVAVDLEKVAAKLEDWRVLH
jgi:hypothetical protein